MMTPTGPCLVEVANRMHGCDGPKTAELCTGAGQHTLTADAVLGGGLFERWQNQDRYPLLQKAVVMQLCNTDLNGILTKDIDCPELRHACARSLYDIYASKAGDKLVPTKCLLTSPGDVLLMHQDE